MNIDRTFIGSVIVAGVAATSFGLAGCSSPHHSVSTGTLATTTTSSTSTLPPPTTTTTVPPATTTTSTTLAPVTTTRPPTPTTRPVTTTHPVATTTPTTQPVLVARMYDYPSSMTFSTLPPPYSPMPKKPVTITNNGTVTIDSISVPGVGVYSVPDNNCGTLAPGASCSVEIQFCPSSKGSYPETLVVTGVNSKTGATVTSTSGLEGKAS